jgi:hypothetical protein
MSLKPSPIPPVPEVTACMAHAAFPHGNVVMQVRDVLGTIYTDARLCRFVSDAWAARRSSLALSTGDSVSIYGTLDGSPGC